MLILCILVFMALTAPWLAPYSSFQPLIGIENVDKREAPCIHSFDCAADQHIMGTDGNVRDEFSRLLYGARLSLMIGLTTVTLAIIIGSVLGALGGYFGGWIDNLIIPAMDVLLAFPSLLLSIVIVTILGPGHQNALLAIGIVSIPAYARIIRASVLSIREMDYVSATRSLGGKSFHILFHRILPNAVTWPIVTGTLSIATAILEAASLSFLGLGAQPPTPEWGQCWLRGATRCSRPCIKSSILVSPLC